LVLGLLAAAGLRWPVALLFFGLVAAFALVYARLRAEAGIPSLWVFPASQQNRLLLNALGAPFLTAGGDPRPLTVLALFSFLARGCFPQLTAYSMENLKMAGEQSPARAHLLRLAFLAMFVGLGVGGYVYLTTCYAYGANVLEGGTIEGGYQTRLARAEYAALGHGTFVPDYKPARAAASGAGLLMTTALLWLRFRFLWFPLHPLGYAMAASFGWVLWGPFLLVWLVKRIVLKRGGPRAYAGLVPAFVGLSLGHFLGGGLWGLLACRLENVYAQYQVWF
jgi:hypothetical protein